MTTWLDAPTCTTHAWRWVPTWANVGFDECWRCGVTGPVREGTAPLEVGAPVDDPIAVPADVPATPRLGRPALPPVAVTPRAEHLAVKGLRGGAAAARDAQIRACLIRGDRAVVVAKQFGISLARVYQIKVAAKRQEPVGAVS